jgi:hypothetical protein
MRRRLSPLLHSRLLHFCVLGGVIFALAPSTRRSVSLSAGTLTALRAAEAARVAPAALDPERARDVDARAIEDELLYREALRLSLDREDPIVRQRLIQKLLLLVEDLGGASRPPTDAELRAYFEATRASWRRPERVHFVHVYAARRDGLPARAALPPGAAAAPPLGEPFPHAREVTDTVDAIARRYGPDVRRALEQADGEWSDPVPSPLGWHRLRVVARLPGGAATFEQVREELVMDFLLARRGRIVGGYLRTLAGSYDLRVDGRPLRRFTPTRRVAPRADPSAED